MNIGEDGKSLVFLDDKVGINTLTPTAKLDIDGPAATDTLLKFMTNDFIVDKNGAIGISVSPTVKDAVNISGKLVIDGGLTIDTNDIDGSSQFSISEQGDIETNGVVNILKNYWHYTIKGATIDDIYYDIN